MHRQAYSDFPSTRAPYASTSDGEHVPYMLWLADAGPHRQARCPHTDEGARALLLLTEVGRSSTRPVRHLWVHRTSAGLL